MRINILGIGNEGRGDDGVGLWVVRQVASQGWNGVEALTVGMGDVASLMEAWEGVEASFLVDAVRAESAPGTILRIDAHRRRLPSAWRSVSTHGLGIAEAIELAREVGALPPYLVDYGIVGGQFVSGEGFSPEVKEAAYSVLRRLRRAVSALGRRG
jgi:hydrogenase maturation protease